MSGFSVEPASFSPAAQEFRAVAQRLTQLWEPVRAQSAAVRFGRGDDILGPLIQVSLAGAVALVEECLSSCAEALGDYADGLELMGRRYQESDDAATDLFRAREGR